MKINFKTPSHPIISGGSSQQSNAKAPDWEQHHGKREDVTYKDNIRFLLTDLSFHSIRLFFDNAAASEKLSDQHAKELAKEIYSFAKHMETLIKFGQYEDVRHFINMAKITGHQYKNNKHVGSHANRIYCLVALIDCPDATDHHDLTSQHPATEYWQENQQLQKLTKSLLEPDEPDVVEKHHFDQTAAAVCAGNPLDYIRISPLFRNAYLRLSAQGDYKPTRGRSHYDHGIRAAAPMQHLTYPR